jgi:hypothetical protein
MKEKSGQRGQVPYQITWNLCTMASKGVKILVGMVETLYIFLRQGDSMINDNEW